MVQLRTRQRRLTAAGVAWDAWRAVRGGPAAVAVRRRSRLEALMSHARSSSRFYAEHHRGAPLTADRLADVPPVTKAQLMDRFDDWVTDPAVTRSSVEAFVADPGALGTDYLGRYVVYTTSGSTGTPALLVQDRRAVAVMTGLAYVRSAGAVTPDLLRRMVGGGVREAAVFATGGHYLAATMFERRMRAVPLRRRFARFFSVLDPLPELVAALEAYRPTLLASYASVLGVLADEQDAGRLHLAPVAVTSGGEQLLPAVRRHLEDTFGCPVFESYSASEAVPLALPCRQGRQHVNADWFVLEPVDEHRRPVPPGRRSETVLVTNLANTVQPVVRYDLGDSVVVGAEPCPCGSPLPTVEVEGRTDEVLRVPGAAGQPVVLLPMALASVVEETPGVRRYQVLQTAPDVLTVRLEADPGAAPDGVWAEAATRLGAWLSQQGAGGVRLARDTVPLVPDPRSGKLRHVVSVREPQRSRAGWPAGA